MDDSVFSSQFQAMRDAFAGEGVDIEVAYTPSGRADYIYETGRLLAQQEAADRIVAEFKDITLVDQRQQPRLESLKVLSIDNFHGGSLTVPQALDIIEERLKFVPPSPGGFPQASPVHVMHITQSSPDTARTCPATEPEVPCCCEADEPCPPCPPLAPDGGEGVLIGICDSGLLADHGSAPWLAGVTGDLDQLGPPLPNGLDVIPRYCGHGTFVAGVARCQAPAAAVRVTADFVMSGGQREWVFVQQLESLLASNPRPQVVNLSAGSYSRNDWSLLSFSAFNHGGVTLTASAGNDATSRPFWPAAFEWAIGVGALGADRRNRAWFSNYGNWVNVYTLGEGLVNAFATGQYTYKEPPKRPAVQVFDGRARWSGTSFSAPLVAGLIAAQMSGTGASADAAAQALLAQARAQAIPGLGPVLFPR